MKSVEKWFVIKFVHKNVIKWVAIFDDVAIFIEHFIWEKRAYFFTALHFLLYLFSMESAQVFRLVSFIMPDTEKMKSESFFQLDSSA